MLFFILLSCFIFLSCTFHWADLSRLTFHYLLYPVWLCMWQIIKNLEPWTLSRCVFSTYNWTSASLVTVLGHQILIIKGHHENYTTFYVKYCKETSSWSVSFYFVPKSQKIKQHTDLWISENPFHLLYYLLSQSLFQQIRFVLCSSKHNRMIFFNIGSYNDQLFQKQNVREHSVE